MKKFLKRTLTFAFAALIMVGMTACGNNEQDSEKKGDVELAMVEWDTEIASTNVVKTVLEDMGYNVKITPLDNAIMWNAVATGDADGMVAAWLPATHGEQYEEYKDQVDDLGANLEGARIGLVVPEYMDVNSIEDLSDEADKIITGIEAGAGVVGAAERALEDYDNLSDWELTPSSSGAMVTAIGEAIDNKEDIVVTGWSPHWKFATYDLKYLEDPKGTFGDKEEIKTMARKGLEDDMPEVYKVLDNFNWSMDDMESVMLQISEGSDPADAAREWVDANQDKVSEWTEE